ncbi:MAG: hypothetical protein D6691_06395 [Candidatus Hydrogenedentota bacterium]|jgi:heme exporter protein D|nr:hypothetical protein [Candidatus Sumerlaea chitinivorans]RMH27285.1 MAG: hypothetical protein D6691_06395 [Candidatus Hydrogenedentota bacterium]
MNEFYVARLPLVGDLATLVVWLAVALVLLSGAVLLFAIRAARLSARIAELETQLALQQRAKTAAESTQPTDSERPIPSEEGFKP